MKLKKGKEEIIYLLNQAIIKFQHETGKEIIQNTNRKNYEALAIALSEISNNLPQTAEILGHIRYEADTAKEQQEYPFRKYDITGGQIKDALMGLVANPRPFLVDTCYIYVYGMGRLAFEKNPKDEYLVSTEDAEDITMDAYSVFKENQQLKATLIKLRHERKRSISRKNTFIRKVILPLSVILLILSVYFFYQYNSVTQQLRVFKNDFKLLPYTPTQAQIDSLEGVWICYIGSPQARLSDPNRYHKVVTNLVEIKYKNGYFLYERYGASFNHTGYIQMEAPGLISIHSRIKNNTNIIESPRHSLMQLEPGKPFLNAISASWSFDVGNKNRIIGIREVYQKLGKGGAIEEVINSVENASCQCKIIRWKKNQKDISTFFLKNMSLDSLANSEMKSMIDERSILLKDPAEEFIIIKKAE
ncbi:hypothetical protein PDL71_02715 [Lacibacter sp. MH-610]|uniref:hypothetical protein n=1 Tax=Lacibacter sp. MH-610 TaxID=3020883 RepID=UPI003891FF74